MQVSNVSFKGRAFIGAPIDRYNQFTFKPCAIQNELGDCTNRTFRSEVAGALFDTRDNIAFKTLNDSVISLGVRNIVLPSGHNALNIYAVQLNDPEKDPEEIADCTIDVSSEKSKAEAKSDVLEALKSLEDKCVEQYGIQKEFN